jgi:hypothetical protein
VKADELVNKPEIEFRPDARPEVDITMEWLTEWGLKSATGRPERVDKKFDVAPSTTDKTGGRLTRG